MRSQTCGGLILCKNTEWITVYYLRVNLCGFYVAVWNKAIFFEHVTASKEAKSD